MERNKASMREAKERRICIMKTLSSKLVAFCAIDKPRSPDIRGIITWRKLTIMYGAIAGQGKLTEYGLSSSFKKADSGTDHEDSSVEFANQQ